MDPLVEYETVADAAPVDAGEPAPVDAAAEPEAVEQAAPDPFEGIDLDAIRALAEAAPSLLTRQPAAEQWQPQPEPSGPPEFDMLDPESFSARLQWEREQTLAAIQEIVSPLSERAQQQAQTEQQELLRDAAHDIEVRKGEFLGDDNARGIARDQMLGEARSLYPEFAARYGNTDRAAELALEAAHERVRGYQDAIAKQAVEQHVNRNQRLAEQHSEPGLGGGSAVETRAAGVYKPGELARKYGGNAQALRQNAA